MTGYGLEIQSKCCWWRPCVTTGGICESFHGKLARFHAAQIKKYLDNEDLYYWSTLPSHCVAGDNAESFEVYTSLCCSLISNLTQLVLILPYQIAHVMAWLRQLTIRMIGTYKKKTKPICWIESQNPNEQSGLCKWNCRADEKGTLQLGSQRTS